MIRKITLLLFICLCAGYVAKAQSCGSDALHQQLMNTNPAYAQKYNQFNTQWKNWVAAQSNPNNLLITLPGGDSVYEIPVVFHIIHTGGTIGSLYNPSDDSIKRWLEITNQIWAANLSGFPQDGLGGTRIPIKFVLAKRDPNCSPTTGILRVNGTTALGASYTNDGVKRTGSAGIDDLTLKALSIWPNDQYYNIWVVNKIDSWDACSPGSGVAGYAYFPGAPADRDGAVIMASHFRYQCGNKINITLAHELGHAFNLHHTFYGGSSSPTNGCSSSATSPGCTSDGDFCCDTEPMEQGSAGSCPTNNSCTGNPFTLNTQRNIMNYSNCQDHFTLNQRDRALLALKTLRPSLISSLGATALPSSSLPSVCVPTYGNTGSPLDRGPIRAEVLYGTNTILDVSSGGYIADGNKVYIDNTCKHAINLVAGSTYTVRCSTAWTLQKAIAYIDLNNDGTFGNSTGETIPLTTSGFVHSASYTVPTGSHVVGCVPLRMRIISDQTSGTLSACNTIQYGQAEDYTVTITTAGSGGTGSVTLNTPVGGNPSCESSTITLTTTVSGSPTITNYAWFRKPAGGGPAVAGPSCATCSTWTGGNTVFTHLDTVWVIMSYTSACGADDTPSNKMTLFRPVTVTPMVYTGIVFGANPHCIDDSISIAVTSNVNPGPSPVYQWRVNGSPVGPAGTVTTFDATGLAEGSTVTVVMTSSASTPCALPPKTAISADIVIDTQVKKPTVSAALISGNNPGCPNQLLTFRALYTNGGTAPVFTWYRNGGVVTGVTGDTYAATFNNNDKVSVRITSSSPCSPAPDNTALSSEITVTHATLTADISISQTSGNNPACSGQDIVFTAAPVNQGTAPNFQWLLNNNPVAGATNINYLTDSLKTGDVVKCVLIATDPCVVNPLDTSNELTITVIQSKIPKANISITKGKNPGCLDSLVEFTALATDIGNNPLYMWKINGFDVSSGTNVYSSTAFLNGDQVVCCVAATDGGCYDPDTVCSNVFNMVRSATPDPPVIHLIGNKLITNIQPGSYIWFGPDGRENIGGEDGNFLPQVQGYYYAVTNNNGCWSKPSNILNIILLDINTLDLGDMKIYPNPTDGKVILDWNGKHVTMDIDVYNAMGQVLMHDKMIETSRKEIDLSKLANGVYYIVVKDGEGKSGNVKVVLDK